MLPISPFYLNGKRNRFLPGECGFDSYGGHYNTVMDNNKNTDKKPKPIIHAVKGIMKRGFGHRPPCAGCGK